MKSKLRRFVLVPTLAAGVGGLCWWAQMRAGPYAKLEDAVRSAKPAQPSGFEWQLEKGKRRQFARPSADGRLAVWSEMPEGWRQTWEHTFETRPEMHYEMAMVDSPPLSGWKDKVMVPLRRLTDPDYRREEVVRSHSVREIFRPALLLDDLDSDGLSDLVVIEKHLELFKGSSDGRFQAMAKGSDLFEPTAPSLCVEDVDGDRVPELIVVCYLNKKQPEYLWQSVIIYSIESLATGWKIVPRYQTLLTDGAGYHSTRGPAVADFDGDGHKEMVVANDNGWIWVLEIRDGKLEVSKPWEVPSGGAVGGAMSAGDLDGDKVPELLVGTNGGDIYACGIDSAGAIRIKGQAMAGRLAYHIGAMDFDGDGTDEMIVVRGQKGYAKMTTEDVKAELWTLDAKSGTLRPVWTRQVRTAGTPHVMNLDGGKREIVLTVGSSWNVLRP